MNKSSLITKEILSPNYGNYENGKYISDRNAQVVKFTPHHTAVVAPAENIANTFTNPNREASANYVIGNDGEIILCVPEDKRPWTSGNSDNDNQAITVEVCNSTGAPNWEVSDKALEALINLGVDICRRYNLPGFTWTGDKNGTLTIHKMFQATACPGPYLESKMPYIAAEITKRLNSNNVLYRVQTGAFSVKANADRQAKELENAGFKTYIIYVNGLYKIQVGAFAVKANAEAMLAKLQALGYNGFITTNSNNTSTPSAPAKEPEKSIEELAKEVLEGKWGNGAERKARLGDKYEAVQAKVEEMLTPKNTPVTTFNVGNMVKMSADAVIYGTNSKFADFVYSSTLYVREINGDKIVISTLASGAVTGAVDKKYLTKI